VNVADRDEFDMYQRAKAEFDKEFKETSESLLQYNQIKTQLTSAHKAVAKQLGKENYTKKELAAMQPATEEMMQYKGMLTQIQNNVNENIPEALKELDEAIKYYNDRLESHFNVDRK